MYNSEETIEWIYNTFKNKEKMPDETPCKIVNFKGGEAHTIGIIHIDCNNANARRGYLYYCEGCNKIFPERILKERMYLVKVLSISGVEVEGNP